MVVGESGRLLEQCVMCWEVKAVMSFMFIAQHTWGFHLLVAESLRNCCTRFPLKRSRSSFWVQPFPRDWLENKQFQLRNGHRGPARPLLDQRHRLNRQNKVIPLTEVEPAMATWRPLTSAERESQENLSSQDKETCDKLVHRLHR